MKPSENIVVQVEKLWDGINIASEKLTTYKSKNDSIDSEYSKLSYDNEQLNSRVRNLEEKLNNYKLSGDNAIDTIKHLEAINSEQSEQIKTLKTYEQEIVNLRLLFENTKLNLKNSEDSNQELAMIVDQLKRELSQIPSLLEKTVELENTIIELENLNRDFEFSRLEIARKNKDLYERNNEIVQLKDRLAELESRNFEYIKLQKEYTGLIENDDISKKQIAEVNKHLSMLKEQLEIEKKKYEDKSAQFIAENDYLRMDILEVKNQLEKIELQKSEMLDRQVSVYDTLADYRNNIELRDRIIYSNELKIKELTDSLLNIEFKLSKLDLLLIEKDSQIIEVEKLNQKIDELSQENEEISIIKELLDVKDSAISDLKTKLSEVSIDKQDLESFALKIKELENVNNELTLLNEEYHQNLYKITAEKAELSVNLKQITEFNEKYKETIKIYADTQLEFEKLQVNFNLTENELNDSKEQLSLLIKAEEEKEMLIAEADNVISRLKVLIDQKELNNNQLESQLHALKTKNEDLEQSNFLLDNEIKYINEEVETKNNEINKLQQQVDDLNKLNFNLIEYEKKIQELKSMYSDSQTFYSELENELISLKQTNASKNNTIEELNSEMERLVQENTYLKDSGRSKLNDSNAQIAALIDENKILNDNLNKDNEIINQLTVQIQSVGIDLSAADTEKTLIYDKQISELSNEISKIYNRENELVRENFAKASQIKYLQELVEIKESKINELDKISNKVIKSTIESDLLESERQSEIHQSLISRIRELEDLNNSFNIKQENASNEIKELNNTLSLKEKQLNGINEFKMQTTKKIQTFIKRIDEMVE